MKIFNKIVTKTSLKSSWKHKPRRLETSIERKLNKWKAKLFIMQVKQP